MTAPPAFPLQITFPPFTFDPRTGELWKDGEAIRLQPQPASLLALFLRNPGELLDRETIRRHLWGDAEVDAEAGIHYAIRQIRKNII